MTALGAGAEGLLPGYLTDPGSGWRETQSDGYQTPEHLKYPYLSTYYVRPTYTEGETVKLSCYVTDWEQSEVRLGDDTKRFNVVCRWTADGGEKFAKKIVKDVKAGDVEFVLGALPPGDYHVGVTAADLQRKLPSHTVWQEFRVVKKGALDIPAAKTLKVTPSMLAKYGIKSDPGRERFVQIPLDENPAKRIKNYYANQNVYTDYYLGIVDKYLAEHPHEDGKGAPGYAVYVPTWQGVGVDRAYQRRRVVYDKGYDRAAVAAEAEANSSGFQRLIAEAWTNGFRKIVFAPGVYRVSHKSTLSVPDATTLDLNGMTLKLDGFAGCHASMLKIAAVSDAHVVNGTIEGDYWQHDYDAPESKNSEWVNGVTIRAMSRYCSMENLTVKYITGYGLVNGGGKEGPGELVRGKPFLNVGGWRNLSKPGMSPGGLDAKGEVDATDKHQWTSGFHDISGFKPWKYLAVSKVLGYQGMATRSWNYVVCFYDEAKKFVSREVAFQYRHVLIPPKAKYARISVEVQGEQEAKGTKMSIIVFKAPRNCAYRNCRADRVRAVGICVNNLDNFLFEGNVIRQSGECLATCALDAEDGWDGMHDALFLHNDFSENHRNQFLTCAGHNFMVVSNKFSISLHPRTFSTYVKDNVGDILKVECKNRGRTGYVRIEGNRCKRLELGGDRKDYDGWDIVMSDCHFRKGDGVSPVKVDCGPTGRFRDSTFDGITANIASAENCVFRNCGNDLFRWLNGRWTGCTAEKCTFTRTFSTNSYYQCTFKDSQIKALKNSPQRFIDCDLSGLKFGPDVKSQCTVE